MVQYIPPKQRGHTLHGLLFLFIFTVQHDEELYGQQMLLEIVDAILLNDVPQADRSLNDRYGCRTPNTASAGCWRRQLVVWQS